MDDLTIILAGLALFFGPLAAVGIALDFIEYTKKRKSSNTLCQIQDLLKN